MRRALHLGDAEADAWTEALVRLEELAVGGAWSQERRLLYDLHSVCIDNDREVYALDLVEWAISLGTRPIRRLLPGQGAVLSLKHLRRALRRLPALTLPVPQRFALAALLEAALHGAEHRLRDRFRPLIEQTLDRVGLCPRDFPERGARHKLVEELLDRITERGFLNLGDLRDALSRNQLKLSDLSGAQELLHGDPLIAANRRFSVTLDGIYQRGEIYLRILQRLSSLAFGTAPGRWLTRFVALPLGGAFFLLGGLQFLIDDVVMLAALVQRMLNPRPAASPWMWTRTHLKAGRQTSTPARIPASTCSMFIHSWGSAFSCWRSCTCRLSGLASPDC